MVPRWGILTIAGILITGLIIGVYLVQQTLTIGKQAAGGADSQFVCDAGPNAYDSNTITLTNNTDVTINEISSNVFRCEYEPDRVRVGFYKCEDDCTGDGPDCQEGIWDPGASTDFSLAPGESRTVSVEVGPCEIVQIDTQNDEVHVADDPTECYNTRSTGTDPAPPSRWQGGIAFGIKQNSEGYNTATGACDVAVPSATPLPTTPAGVPTPQPTTPAGVPTNTPVPTATSSIPTNTPIPYVPPTNAPAPTHPVSGSGAVTAIGIVGGIVLLVLTLL